MTYPTQNWPAQPPTTQPQPSPRSKAPVITLAALAVVAAVVVGGGDIDMANGRHHFSRTSFTHVIARIMAG